MLHIISRSCRIAQELKKEIAVILQQSLRDPRLHNIITVSDVRLSQDLSNAKIFVSFLNEQEEMFLKNSIKILNNAAGFMQILLRKRMNLRIVPKLIFIYDNSFIKGIHMSNLIKNTKKSEHKN